MMMAQCDDRHTITFPAAEHPCPLDGTKLYCSATEAHDLPRVTAREWRLSVEPAPPVDRKSSVLTTTPPSHNLYH